MATEVEIRLLHVDIEQVEERLIALGATFHSCVLLREVRFFGLSGNPVEYVRVRDDGTRVRLQHKAHTGDGVSAAESDLLLDETVDYATAVQFCQAMGLRRWRAVERMRTQYTLGRAIISIDQLPGIPPHVEVEAEALVDVLKTCARLGLDPAAHVDGGLPEIYRAHGAEQRLTDDLAFTDDERHAIIAAITAAKARSHVLGR